MATPRKPSSSRSGLSGIKAAVKEQAVAAAPQAAASQAPAPGAAPKHERKLDKYGRAYATGKRKNAIARVWIKPGSGKVVVNGRELKVYFARPVLQMIV